MPTGYTAALYEGRPTSFPEFVWTCARAFTDLIHMRDDRLDAPIRFPTLDRYAERVLDGHRADLAKLLSLTEEEAEQLASADYERAVRDRREAVTRAEQLTARYQAMRDQVLAWTPPTPEHEGLRNFMLEQLDTSARYDTYKPTEPVRLSGPTWLAQELERVHRDIAYYEDAHRKAVARFEEGRAWLEELAKSVPLPEKKAMKVIVQKWEESERGWGTRPDGYSLHRSHIDLDAFVKAYWDSMPNEAPSEYSRPCGTPYDTEVSSEVFDAVAKSKNGTRHFDNNYPGDGGSDGWR